MDFEFDLGLLATVGAGGLTIILGLLFSILWKHDRIKNFANSLPIVMDAIRAFVAEAEARHEAILEEYSERAHNEGKDARLLWVIDQAEVWIKQRTGYDIDINWLMGHVEEVVRDNKRKDVQSGLKKADK